jgi:hypothetical protein
MNNELSDFRCSLYCSASEPLSEAKRYRLVTAPGAALLSLVLLRSQALLIGGEPTVVAPSKCDASVAHDQSKFHRPQDAPFRSATGDFREHVPVLVLMPPAGRPTLPNPPRCSVPVHGIEKAADSVMR